MNTPATKTQEQEMREATVPTPQSADELLAYVTALVEREHDYGTCVYAMSMAATAAFRFVASQLGVTGFQASCADMDVLRRTRHINGPFMLLKGEDALFPQYDLRGRLDEFLRDIQPWLAEQVTAKLQEPPDHAHPDVVRHWQRLAAAGKPMTHAEEGAEAARRG